MEPVLQRATQLAIIAALVAEDGPLDDIKIHLFANDIVPGPFTALADFTAPTFTGYAVSAALVWGAPVIEPGGAAAVYAPSVQFTCTADGTENIIYGYWTQKTTGGTVYVTAVRFDEPVPIEQAGDFVIVNPKYVQPQAA